MATRSERHDTPSGGTAAGGGIDFGSALHAMLRLIGFAATTLLITWGLLVAMLLSISGCSLDGLMAQLANLAVRYVAADPARVADFKHILLVGQLLLAAAITVFRRHRLVALFPAHRSLRHD